MLALLLQITFVGEELIAERGGVEHTLRGPQGQSDICLKVGWQHSFRWRQFNYMDKRIVV